MTTLRNIIELNKYQKNKASYLEWDNGGFQYIWVVCPTVLSLGLVMELPKLSIIYNLVEIQD